MFENIVRSEIRALDPYVPGLSIEEIRAQYGIEQVIKMASNENPLGTSPLVQECIARHAGEAFRYPAGGNPRLVAALAAHFGVPASRIVVGNGSDEILDLLVRMLAVPGRDNIACFRPCFSIYPIQAQIAGVEVRRQPIEADFSFDFEKLLSHVDKNTRLVFVTTPDNPSGYCPKPSAVKALASRLPAGCLLVVDEAYMDFAPDEGESEADWSLLAAGDIPANAVVVRTFSKSFGMAGLRVGVGIFPEELAGYYWRMRLPFSVNILAESAAIVALGDTAFREATLACVRRGRAELSAALAALGCRVYPSRTNFVMFGLPAGRSAQAYYKDLLARGVIVRSLKSYGLPDLIRVSVGSPSENATFLRETKSLLGEAR